MSNGTIIAASTPPGSGAICIIRISGSESIRLTDLFFKSRSGIKLSKSKPLKLILGDFIVNNLLRNRIADLSELSLVFIQTAISTVIILIAAEFIPKVIFQIYSNFFIRIFAVPAYVFYIIEANVYTINAINSCNIVSVFCFEVEATVYFS